MARIRRLAEEVANQIAAGEVVERPASVLKELLENAVDAGAARIEAAIEGGGKLLVRVADDGSGIDADDLRLALERHATSKLVSAEDLSRMTTLGFRGEALPSIASVSRLTLTTLAAGASSGTRIHVAAGRVESLETVPFAPGTTVEVRDLFFSVPARLKFLKAQAAETAACTQVFQRLALAHPEIHLTLSVHGRTDLTCPRAASLRERVGQLLGHERAALLVEVRGADGGMRLEGLIEPPGRHQATRVEQHLFVNRRPVADRTLSHAVIQAYEGLLPPGRFPAAILHLAIDPALVDVNVHPAKSEVRFVDARAVHARVASALREALARGGFIPEMRAVPHAEGVRQAVASYLDGAAAAPARTYRLFSPTGGAALSSPGHLAPAAPARPLPTPSGYDAAGPCGAAADRVAEADASEVAEAPGPRLLGQFRRCFLVAADERGLLLVDQHTAHERVLYEKLLAGSGSGEAQRLLIAELVEVPPALRPVLEESLADLAAAGLEIEPMGGGSYAVRSMPLEMRPGSPRRLLIECLAELAAGVGTGAARALGERRERLLATVACHAAVKVNMALETAKMEWLLAELMRARDPYLCPHGRAVILRLDDEAIKKSFGRTW